MKSSLLYRMLFVLGLLILAAVLLVPTFVCRDPARACDELPSFWKNYLPTNRIRLGLDLQGGTHLVLSVDVDKAIQNHLQHIGEEIKREAADKKITVNSVEHKETQLEARISNADSRTAFSDFIKDTFPNLTAIDSSTQEGVAVIKLALVKPEEKRLREFALDQSLETIRNRIDQFGVTEPIIQRQGTQDILVQLPGIQDPQRAKELIGKTALLEFKLLSEDPATDDYTAGRKPAPADTTILSGYSGERVSGRAERTKYLVESKTLMTGEVIADALVRPATDMDGPHVSLELDPRGAKQFGDLTTANVGRRLAIVLDNTVYSAPQIREPITGGSASITGNFDIKEARDLAIVLRAGALPAPVSIIEERTVGPSLGQDSIEQGIRSFIVAGTMVMIFMLVYYRFAGLLADLALTANAVFLLATLGAIGATLTLPGIAGVVLTLGMAVDANVLINERIREELRAGKTPRAAIEAGYDRALPSILDSNITTLLSGVILFQFGSGPIRGFAVTLFFGLIIHVFTAVFCTRVVWDYLLSTRRLQKVSI